MFGCMSAVPYHSTEADDFYAQLVDALSKPAPKAQPIATSNASSIHAFETDDTDEAGSSWIGLFVATAVAFCLISFTFAVAPADIRTTVLANGGHAVGDLADLLAAALRQVAR